jgi:hypothetical protein
LRAVKDSLESNGLSFARNLLLEEEVVGLTRAGVGFGVGPFDIIKLPIILEPIALEPRMREPEPEIIVRFPRQSGSVSPCPQSAATDLRTRWWDKADEAMPPFLSSSRPRMLAAATSRMSKREHTNFI